MLERSCIVACSLKASSKSIAAEVMDFDQLVAEIAGLKQPCAAIRHNSSARIRVESDP